MRPTRLGCCVRLLRSPPKWSTSFAVLSLLSALPLAAQGPAIELEPSRVLSEDEVEVRGSGFCYRPPCAPVAIRMQGVVVVEEAAVGEDGTFRTTFVADAGPGTYRVTAATRNGEEQTGEGAQASAELVVEYGPRLILEPTEVRAGQIVTIWGLGFPEREEGEAITVMVDGAVVAKEVGRREDGTLEAYVQLDFEPGIYEIAVTRRLEGADEIVAVAEVIVGVGEQEPGPREKEGPDVQ